MLSRGCAKRVPVDFREREVHKLSYLIKGQMDHKEPVEKLELQDQLEKGEIQVKLETQGREEHLVLLEHKEKEEILDLMVTLVAPVSLDLLAKKDYLDHKVQKVSRVSKDLKVELEDQENWELQGLKVTLVLSELLAILDQLVPEDHQENWDLKESVVKKDREENLEMQEVRVVMEEMVRKEREENQDCQEPPEPLVNRVKQEREVYQDFQEP